jgi:hypothetical protein
MELRPNPAKLLLSISQQSTFRSLYLLATVSSKQKSIKKYSIKSCYKCHIKITPLWRKINNKIYCNACGLSIKRYKK